MDANAPLGIVVGMKFEAAVLGRWKSALGPSAPLVAIAAGRKERAEDGARRMIDSGVQGLVSFGIAGALDKDLTAGSMVVPEHVLGVDGERHETDRHWRDGFRATLLSNMSMSEAGLVTVTEPVVTAADKQRLAEASGAAAVDMESLWVANVASDRGVPFLVVRAIADEAGPDLPDAARSAMRADGSIGLGGVLKSLLTSPGQIGALLKLGGQSRKAQRTLARVAHRGLPRFGLP